VVRNAVHGESEEIMRIGSKPRLRAALPAALMGLLACGGDGARESAERFAPATASREVDADPSPDPPALQSFVYECDAEVRVVAHFAHPDSVRLVLPDQSVVLPRVRAASGAKYADGSITFWTKANEATIERAGGDRRTCLENRRLSVIEDARRRGMEIWATGNEPGWTLQIGPEQILYTGDYGATRLSFPSAQPQVDAVLGRTTYTTEREGQTLEVSMVDEECLDDMSGEPFSLTVELRLGGRLLRGCGHRLR
jgi:membrane-bound inhibitor of C-type lysozyme